MKTQDMKNEDMLEILNSARREGELLELRKDYITQLANLAFGKISILLFTNALNGVSRTTIKLQELKDMIPLEYAPMVTDSTCGPILNAVEEVYRNRDYTTALYTDSKGNGIELVITITDGI